MLNALSILFRTSLVSFKSGGKGSAAMREIESYLKAISVECQNNPFFVEGFLRETQVLDFDLGNMDFGIECDIDISALNKIFVRECENNMIVPPVSVSMVVTSVKNESFEEPIHVKVEVKVEVEAAGVSVSDNNQVISTIKQENNRKRKRS
jgi:hypothetical protein